MVTTIRLYTCNCQIGFFDYDWLLSDGILDKRFILMKQGNRATLLLFNTNHRKQSTKKRA